MLAFERATGGCSEPVFVWRGRDIALRAAAQLL